MKTPAIPHPISRAFFVVTICVALAVMRSPAFGAKPVTIWQAVPAGDVAKVKELLTQNPDLVKAQFSNKETPLWLAATGTSIEMVQLLLDSGADVNAHDTLGWEPLHCAANTGNKEIANILIAHGADVNATEQYGWTPLHLAAAAGYKDCVELLLAHKAEVNAQDVIGGTPLYWAQKLQGASVAEVLRQHGGKTNAVAPGMPNEQATASGKVYHVDFDKGKDDADGLSENTAFKHSPGDPGAQGHAKDAQLQPGDTVLFKGGVIYRGNLECKFSGTDGMPITYDGNTKGTYGKGPAVIDGSEVLTGLQRCKSAEEAKGNPNWKNLWWGYLPAGLEQPEQANLCEGDQWLFVAQLPKQDDPFYPNNAHCYQKIPNTDMTQTSLTDQVLLNQTDPHYWDDAYALMLVLPNVVVKSKIEQFVPTEHRIIYTKFSQQVYTGGYDEFYSIINSLHILTAPGEYVALPQPDGRMKVFLWPHDPASPEAGRITVSTRRVGVELVRGSSHVIIQGFTIQKFAGPAGGQGSGLGIVADKPSDLIIRNNTIAKIRSCEMWGYGGIDLNAARDALIEGNHIEECPFNIGMLLSGVNLTIKNNVLKKIGGKGIWLMPGFNVRIVGNEVLGAGGAHVTGISVFLGSRNVLIAGNKVFANNEPLTTESSDYLTIVNNIFYTTGWGYRSNDCDNHLKFFNNVMICDDKDGSMTGYPALRITYEKGDDIIVRNNIISVAGGDADKWVHDHNLYIVPAGKQADKKMADGDLRESNPDKIFMNPKKYDFRLKPGSPAIGAGVDVGLPDEESAGARSESAKTFDIGVISKE